MTAEWTAERLEALPEGTVIRWTEDGYPELAMRGNRSWRQLRGREIYSETVMEDAEPGSIRVMSVPVDALLSAESAWLLSGELNAPLLASDIAPAMAALVAHITGEAP